MIISALKYSRYNSKAQEWCIVGRDEKVIHFSNINLLVGKNASGKSRTLNVLREISNLLSERVTLNDVCYPTQKFEVVFDDENDQYIYFLEFEERIVREEIVQLNGKEILNRKNRIATDATGKTISIDFGIDDRRLLICENMPETIDCFDKIKLWGKSLRNYLFANHVEKNKFILDYSSINDEDQNIDEPNILLYTFNKGKELFEQAFISEIINCMQELDYYLSDISIGENDEGYGLYVKEDNDEYALSQREMSQGMFRSLSLFIMLIYAQFNNMSICLLIDDIGEGLDFESSKKLINLVIKKINNSKIQIFMTTNDRYIMNQIPLKYWLVIGRDKNKSIFYDYINSTETFEDFKYTGLNNSDFLATDFFRTGFGVIDEEDNE